MFDLSQPKFIIQDNELRMGRVVMHKELASKDGGEILGGGYWNFDKDNNILYLYGESVAYGGVNVEQIKNAWKRPSLENSTIIFSESDLLDTTKKLGTKIQ